MVHHLFPSGYCAGFFTKTAGVWRGRLARVFDSVSFVNPEAAAFAAAGTRPGRRKIAAPSARVGLSRTWA